MQVTFLAGLCVGPSEKFETISSPSLARFEPDVPVLTRRGVSSIFQGYNLLLDEAAAQHSALILMHDDVELTGSISAPLRALFADPTIAIVGVIGARRPRGMAWWTAAESDKRGQLSDSFHELHFGDEAPADVDVLDGLLLCLSPWAVQSLRFDDKRYKGFHGYDADVCATALAAGKRVVTAPLPVFHHNKQPSNVDAYFVAEWTYRLRWHQPSRRDGVEWRARRAYHALRSRYAPRDF